MTCKLRIRNTPTCKGLQALAALTNIHSHSFTHWCNLYVLFLCYRSTSSVTLSSCFSFSLYLGEISISNNLSFTYQILKLSERDVNKCGPSSLKVCSEARRTALLKLRLRNIVWNILPVFQAGDGSRH